MIAGLSSEIGGVSASDLAGLNPILGCGGLLAPE